MQNEMIKAMAISVLQSLGKSSDFFTVMCDECTDSSNREQLSVWINSQFEPHEDFIGLYSVCATDIVQTMKKLVDNDMMVPAQ